MARKFVIEVEGMTPEVSASMIKDALDNALNSYREKIGKGIFGKLLVRDKQVRTVLENLQISKLSEDED